MVINISCILIAYCLFCCAVFNSMTILNRVQENIMLLNNSIQSQLLEFEKHETDYVVQLSKEY